MTTTPTLSTAVRATRRLRRRAACGGNVPLPEFTDLSRPEDEVQRAIYRLLVREWWPHLLHGPTHYAYSEEAIVFSCPCGDSLTVMHEVAEQLGLFET